MNRTITTTTVDFPRRVRVQGRDLHAVPGSVYDRYEARVPVLDAATSPVVLVASGVTMNARVRSCDIAWRRDDCGRHWRPMHAAGLDGRLPAGSAQAWRDHPLAKAVLDALRGCRGGSTHASSIRGGRRGVPELETSVLGDLAAEVGRDELAEIGGVLHRRAELPVWALVREGGPTSALRVRLVLPEQVGPDDALALFPVDRLEDAVGAMNAPSCRETDEPVRAIDPVIGEVHAHGEIDWRPGVVASLNHAVDLIERGMVGFSLGSLPRRVVSAYGVLLDRTARMSRAQADPDRDEFQATQWELEDFMAAIDGMEGMGEVSRLAATLRSTLAMSCSHDRAEPFCDM